LVRCWIVLILIFILYWKGWRLTWIMLDSF
jgi:hypothetical protein